MQIYPKMNISAKTFSTNLPRLQNYITERKYWKNANKHGEKSKFIKKFSLENRYFLTEREKHALFTTQRYLLRMFQLVKRQKT